MKKTLWTMAAALALVGCSQDNLMNVDNTPVQEQNAIAFSTYVGDNAQSRAAVVTTETLGKEGFGVNAWYTKDVAFAETTEKEDFMNNVKVTNYEGKGWTYSPVKYWPNNKFTDDEGNSRYEMVSFFAYGPYGLTENSSLSEDRTAVKFKVEPDVKDQVDLIYSNNYGDIMNQGKPAVDSKILFNFAHALSRISFTVQAAVDDTEVGNKLDGNTRINVRKVALVGDAGYDADALTGPFYKEGTLNLLEPETEEVEDEEGEMIERYVSPWSGQSGEQGFEFNATAHFRHTVKDIDPTQERDEDGNYPETDVVQLTKFNNIEKVTLLNDASYLMVIPQDLRTSENEGTSEGFKIYIEYDVISETSEGNDPSIITNRITSEEALSVEFKQGMAYNFNLILGMTSVKFDASVNTWADPWDEEHDEWLPENEEGEEDDDEGDDEGEGGEDSGAGGDETLEEARKLAYSDGKLIIATAEDLAAARDYINAGAKYTIVDGYAVNVTESRSGDGEQYAYNTASYLQTADIDLNNELWTPIGTYNQKFQGTYDVDMNDSDEYYTISNLKIDDNSKDGALFLYVTEATLANIHIASCNINAKMTAAIAVYAADSEIKNCVVGNAESSEACTVTGSSYTAGITSNCLGTNISNCVNYAKISGPTAPCGIGYSNAVYSGCYNYGNINYTGDANGEANGISSQAVSVVDCHNYGTITAPYASGIGGRNAEYIYACHNEGEIKASYAGGGITANASCLDFKACYNVGSVTGSYFAGGIIGYVSNGSSENPKNYFITSCYNSGTITSGYAFADYMNYKEEHLTTTPISFKACYYTNASNAVGYTDEDVEETRLLTEENGVWWHQEETRVVKIDVAYCMNEGLGENFGWRYEPNPSAATNTASETYPLILVPNE